MRRGKPVAVIVSRGSYDRLRDRSEGQRLLASIQRFRETHDLAALDIPSIFDDLRDKSTDGVGRKVKW
jgi:PHD/YefM family antitoxin component YafN of YafNO toxin-antitoxin module